MGENAKEKSYGGIGFKFVYWVVMVLFVVVWLYVPEMGKDVLKYELIKNVSFLLLGIVMTVVLVMKFILHKRNDFEDRTIKDIFGSVAGTLVTVLILGVGFINITECIQDKKQGEVVITLTHTQVETKTSASRRAGRRTYVNRSREVLKGYVGYDQYSFNIGHGNMNDSTKNAINEENPKVTVIYYPNSKAIIQVQIHLADETVVLPAGDKLIEIDGVEQEPVDQNSASTSEGDTTTGVENQDGDSSTKVDTDETEEDVLYGVKIGDDYVTAVQTLMLNGYHYELVTPANVEIIQAEEDDIRTEYGIADSQDIKVLRNGNVELIIVYNDETKVIEDLIVDGERQ